MSPSLWYFFLHSLLAHHCFPLSPEDTYFSGLQLFLGQSPSADQKLLGVDNCLIHLYIACSWCTCFALKKYLLNWINSTNDVLSVSFLLFRLKYFLLCFCLHVCGFPYKDIPFWHASFSFLFSGFKNKRQLCTAVFSSKVLSYRHPRQHQAGSTWGYASPDASPAAYSNPL